MTSLFRLRLPSRAAIRSAAVSDTFAGRFVALVTVAAVGLLTWFVAKYASRVPCMDELSLLSNVFGPNQYTWASYWHQHNEHRIPLPKILYVAAVRLAGFDFRAPMYLDVVLLVGAAVFLLRTVRRVRGRWSVADALIPLAVLGVGSTENLLNGFQVQFVSSTVVVLTVVGLLAVPGYGAGVGRVAAIGVCAVLLPFCGANGLALVPALGLFQLYAGIGWLRAGRRSVGWVSLVAGLATVATVPVYYAGLQRIDHTAPPPSDVLAVAVTFVNALGMAFGPVTQSLHPPGYTGVAALGVVAAVIAVGTGVLLLAAVRDPQRRTAAVGLGCVLGGLLCLAGGLAYGRSGLGSILPVNRYCTLTMPVLVVAYLAWVRFGSERWARLVPLALCAAVALCVVPNTRAALGLAAYHSARLNQVSHDLQAGVPLSFLVDRHPFMLTANRGYRREVYEILWAHGVPPFSHLAADPELREDVVPLRVLRTEGVTEADGWYRVVGDRGGVVLALPRRQHVYGLKLMYQTDLGFETGHASLPLPSVLSWDADGRFPPAAGRAIPWQLVLSPTPQATLIHVNDETDVLRVDLCGAGTAFRVHGLSVLSRAP